MYRATLTKNMPMERAASDQASHEVARVLIPLAPCSGAWFPRSRRHSTVLPSPKRYGKRYENEMTVVKAARKERHRRRNLRSPPRQRWKQPQVTNRCQVPVLAPRKWTCSRPRTKSDGFCRPVCWGKKTRALRPGPAPFRPPGSSLQMRLHWPVGYGSCCSRSRSRALSPSRRRTSPRCRR
jgi:hypothetical protein